MQERVLFVHAHPDDETISTGGTIATLINRGAQVTVVTCTRGERGGVMDSSQRALEGDHEALAAVRVQELSAALATLGVTDHRFLGSVGARSIPEHPRRYEDSGMRWGVTPTGVPTAMPSDDIGENTLTAADPVELVDDLTVAIEDACPHAIVSYDADGGYGHPDHIRAHQIARAAAHEHGIPFFIIESVDSRAAGIVEVDVAPVADRKREALGAYATQLRVRGDEFVSPGGQVETISMTERFRRIRPDTSGQWSSSPIAARIIASLVALVIGAIAGAVLTVAHQAAVVIGTVVVPWGIIAAVIVTAALLAGLRIVFETRVVAGLAALGLLGIAAFLALQSAGGSILVPANPVGYIWTFAPVIIAGVVLAWPRITRASRGTIKLPAAKGSDPL